MGRVGPVVRFDERALLRVLLAAFAVSFLLLYGWYFLFLGFDDGIFYLAVAADFLYLAGALVIGCASLLANVTRAGLPDIRFHDLRHTCATLLLSGGHHPKLVQDLLGHASVALTLDRYSHVLPGMGDQTAKAMEAGLS